jgi:hypothetical protein
MNIGQVDELAIVTHFTRPRQAAATDAEGGRGGPRRRDITGG